MSSDDTKRIRKQFKKTILPGLVVFLEEFTPYKKYISECRNFEKEASQKSDLARHAFMKLRFGTHNADPKNKKEDELIKAEFSLIEDGFEELKSRAFPELISLDIGMRGIMCAYGKVLKEPFLADMLMCEEKYRNWEEYSTEAAKVFSEISDEGWFESYYKIGKEKRNFLTHIVFKETGEITNYKHKDVADGLGCFLLLLFFSKLVKNPKSCIEKKDMEKIFSQYSDDLFKTYERGFKQKFRAELNADDVPRSQEEFAKVLREKAKENAKTQIKKMMSLVELS